MAEKRNGKLVTSRIQYGYDTENAISIEHDDGMLKVKKANGEDLGKIYAKTPSSTEDNALTTVSYLKDPNNSEVYKAFLDFIDDHNLGSLDDVYTVSPDDPTVP